MKYRLKSDLSLYLFDFFGTISVKKEPDSSFLTSWSNQIGKRLGISPSIVSEVRTLAAKMVSSRSPVGEFTYDDLLDNIWDRFSAYANYHLPIDRQMFCSYARAQEQEWKYKNQVLNLDLLSAAAGLFSQGKQLCILSDYYLGEEFIRFMLGPDYTYLFQKIFVSCEIGANKSSGTAFPLVLESLSISPDQCIMIGDNYYSDIFRAKHCGLKTKFIKTNGLK